MAAISGQTNVAAAGTEVSLGTQQINGPLMVRAKPANTGYIYLGNNGDGTVSSSTGIILAAGDAVIFDWVVIWILLMDLVTARSWVDLA
jgi:hypothetical protein